MINIGIIGLGRISKKHLNAINKNRNFKLTAVCDIDQTKLDQIKLPKINKYKSIDLMKKYKASFCFYEIFCNDQGLQK